MQSPPGSPSYHGRCETRTTILDDTTPDKSIVAGRVGAAIYTTEFDAVLQRVEAAGLGHEQIGTIILARDPAGNVVEVVPLRAQ